MVTPIMPADRGNGLAMRSGFFLDAYSSSFDVDLVVAPIAGQKAPSPFVLTRTRRLMILDLDRPDSHYALIAAIRDPITRLDHFRSYGRPSLSAFVRPASQALDQLAEDVRYQIVHVSRVYLAELTVPWIERQRDRPLLILDCDENDEAAYRRLAALERRTQRPVSAAWADAEAASFGRFIVGWLPRFDRTFVSSAQEMRSMSIDGGRTMVIPNVVRIPVLRRHFRQAHTPTIVFVGSLGYGPNVDAVIWFVSHVWRRLEIALHNRIKLIIVGADPPPAIARLRYRRGIHVTGAVTDVAAYYSRADIAIVPIRAGGGTRIKVIEAAAHGVPVVTTAFGAEGTSFQNGAEVLMADGEANFLRACLLLARKPSLLRRLAMRARAKARRDYSAADWRARVARLMADAADERV